jgi:hypothetical protein
MKVTMSDGRTFTGHDPVAIFETMDRQEHYESDTLDGYMGRFIERIKRFAGVDIPAPEGETIQERAADLMFKLEQAGMLTIDMSKSAS